MIKSTKSLLLVAMMAVSGLATAQPAAPDVPKSRAEVKSQTTPQKAGTDGGEGPSAAEKAKPGSMPNTRADVKAQTTPEKSGIQGGEGATKAANPSTAMTGTKKVTGAHNMDNMYDKGAASRTKRKPVSKADVQKEGKSSN